MLKSVLNIHWKSWCWGWSSNPLATWCKELTHWDRPWCWERLKAGEEGDDRGWDVGWHHWLDSRESEKALGVGDGQGSLACCSGVEHNWAAELQWTRVHAVQVTPSWEHLAWGQVRPTPAPCSTLRAIPKPQAHEPRGGPAFFEFAWRHCVGWEQSCSWQGLQNDL